MLFVLSPAKALDYESPLPTQTHSAPLFVPDSVELIKVLRDFFDTSTLDAAARMEDPNLTDDERAALMEEMMAPPADVREVTINKVARDLMGAKADVTGKLPQDLNWAALADPHAVTVIFMGQRSFPDMAAGLIAHGLPADTPALIAEAITQPGQTLRRGTVAELAETLRRDGPSPAPALIFYGPLAEISDAAVQALTR